MFGWIVLRFETWHSLAKFPVRRLDHHLHHHRLWRATIGVTALKVTELSNIAFVYLFVATRGMSQMGDARCDARQGHIAGRGGGKRVSLHA